MATDRDPTELHEEGTGEFSRRKETASQNSRAETQQDLGCHLRPGSGAPLGHQERLSAPVSASSPSVHSPPPCTPAVSALQTKGRNHPLPTAPFSGYLSLSVLDCWNLPSLIPHLQGRSIVGPAWSPGWVSVPERGEEHHGLERMYLSMVWEGEPQIPRMWRKSSVPRKLEGWARQICCGCLSNS